MATDGYWRKGKGRGGLGKSATNSCPAAMWLLPAKGAILIARWQTGTCIGDKTGIVTAQLSCGFKAKLRPRVAYLQVLF